MITDDLDIMLRPSGLMTRGAFNTVAEDALPGVGTIVMIGNAGSGMWSAARTGMATSKNPLDDWTARILSEIAENYGARAVFPSDGPPYHPFQRWAMRADDVTPSPIGPLIHPRFGLWHAYRGAFLFEACLTVQTPTRSPSPCDSCATRPCLSTCPVGAFSAGSYDVPACRHHIATDDGRDCLETGCRARRACPIGQDYLYDPEQAAFHMRHFLHSTAF